MAIRACILDSEDTSVTIGWANVAQYPSFREWLSARMAAGYRYAILTPDRPRNILYNAALKMNMGVSQAELQAVFKIMGAAYLTSGDVSIIRLLSNPSYTGRMAETAQDVLDNDTLELGR